MLELFRKEETDCKNYDFFSEKEENYIDKNDEENST